MRVTTYMFVSSAGNVRVNKTGSGTRPNELRLEVSMYVPDAIFQRPTPVVDIHVPDVRLPDTTDVMIELAAESVAKALQVDVRDVQDGLAQAVKQHQDRQLLEEGGEEA